MRRRITLVHGGQDQVDSNTIQVEKNKVQLRSIKAAREDRFTASPHELPQELWLALKQLHELHICWVSPRPSQARPPFLSYLPPGLHLSYTPLKNRDPTLLCPALSKTFNIQSNCSTFQNAFTRPSVVSQRFASTASFQYYDPGVTSTELALYIREKFCTPADTACQVDAQRIRKADHIDIDYDTISQTFAFSTFFSHPPSFTTESGPPSWSDEIGNYDGYVATEIGLLQNEKPIEAEHLKLGGYLLTIGKDQKPKSTLFSFPSRHHALPRSTPLSYRAAFVHPTGLHPKLRLDFKGHTQQPDPSCALHTYLTIPSSLFPDKYQLSSPNLLASKNLRALRAVSGETDLEAPDWAVQGWGSSLLLELAPPPDHRGEWFADIPLHLRYLQASGSRGNHSPHDQATISVPWPIVFWACAAESGTKMNTNPFDRTNLGYDGLFGPKTLFYHLSPARNHSRFEEITVPILDPRHTQLVESVSVGVILLGFLWICRGLLLASRGRPSALSAVGHLKDE